MSRDPRENRLNDAARIVMVQSNYDPHFSGLEERTLMETRLFLARYDALASHYSETPPTPWIDQPREPADFRPIPMILFCPSCGVQHVDAPAPHKVMCSAFVNLRNVCTCGAWTNPPHRSHLCGSCNHVWRPADVPTTGVADIQTHGKADGPQVRGRITFASATEMPVWRHNKRGTVVEEIGRGELQSSGELRPYEGTRMVAYREQDGTIWFRLEAEFEDGRFTKEA